MSEKASWELAEGDEIAQGRRVLRPLGGGRRCEAYLVWDEGMCTRLVAKLLRPDRLDDGAALRALRRESETLAALAHPAIPRCFEAVLEPPHPHLLLEHFEGASLRRLLRHGPLPAERVAGPAIGVVAALAYLHAQGWLHLDVKPDHVVCGQPAHLIDLSLARTLERAERLSEPVGTNAYMAPEQCAPAGDVGPPADLWGLGATLFRALAGRRPFPKPPSTAPGTPLEVRFPQLVERPGSLPASVPAPLARVVVACLHPTPAERPTAAELVRELEPPASRQR